MIFFVGVDRPGWLDATHHRWTPWQDRYPAGHPMMVSLTSCRSRRTWPRHQVAWALDNGAFASILGERAAPPTVDDTIRAWWQVHDAGGRPSWMVAPDWPAHPDAMARCGYGTTEAIERTVEQYLEARDAGPAGVLVAPVLTGNTAASFETCAGAYAAAGVELGDCPLVAVGGMVTAPAATVRDVAGLCRDLAIRAHWLGLKGDRLRMLLAEHAETAWSSDSAAWSYTARREPGPMPGCTHPGRCTHCFDWAMRWSAAQADAAIVDGLQPALF